MTGQDTASSSRPPHQLSGTSFRSGPSPAPTPTSDTNPGSEHPGSATGSGSSPAPAPAHQPRLRAPANSGAILLESGSRYSGYYPAVSCTLYVAPNGSSSASGTTTQSPLSLLGAARVAVAGDVVCIAPGSYTLTSTFEPSHSGNSSAWITYTAYGDSQSISPGRARAARPCSTCMARASRMAPASSNSKD